MRQGSHDKSPDSKESSPQSKRSSGDPHRLSQQLDLQSDQRQLQPPDTNNERELPIPLEPPTELPSEETSLPKPPEHSKAESADSRHSEPLEDTPTQEEPPTADTEPAVSTPPPESVISPTLKMAARQIGEEEESVNKLQGLSEDSLGDALLDMLEQRDPPDKSHDTSGDQAEFPQGEQIDKQPEEPVPEEGVSMPSSDERESVPPTEDVTQDTTITEPGAKEEGREEGDGLEILAELDEVLDKEDQESSEEEEEEDNDLKMESGEVTEQSEAAGEGATESDPVAPVGEDKTTSEEEEDAVSKGDDEGSHDPPEPHGSHDPSEQLRSHDLPELQGSHDPSEQLRSNDPPELQGSHDPPDLQGSHDPPDLRESQDPPECLTLHDPPELQESHDLIEQPTTQGLPEVQISHDPSEQSTEQASEK